MSQLTVLKVEHGETITLCTKTLDAQHTDIVLRLEAEQQDLRFLYSLDDGTHFTEIIAHLNGQILSTDVAGGFVGNTMGIYATSNGKESDTFATFDYIEYIPCNELNLK